MHGKGDEEAGFKTPLKKLRGLSATYNNYIQIVATADSGIRTVADLKGQARFGGRARSPATELNARAVLKAAGLGYKDLAKVEYLPFGESVELMKNRQLDATLQSAGLGRRVDPRPRDVGQDRRRADSRRRRREGRRSRVPARDDSREHLQGSDARRRDGGDSQFPRDAGRRVRTISRTR